MEQGISVDVEVYASGRIEMKLWDPATGERFALAASAAEYRKLIGTLSEAVEAAEGSARG